MIPTKRRFDPILAGLICLAILIAAAVAGGSLLYTDGRRQTAMNAAKADRAGQSTAIETNHRLLVQALQSLHAICAADHAECPR